MGRDPPLAIMFTRSWANRSSRLNFRSADSGTLLVCAVNYVFLVNFTGGLNRSLQQFREVFPLES